MNATPTTTMHAFGLTKKPEVGRVADELQELKLGIPDVKETEVRVKILASTLHIDDIALAQGTALGRFLGPKEVSLENPYVMGSSFSGVICETGEKVIGLHVGDEVLGIPSKTGEHGSWATYRCLDEKDVRIKPKELTHSQAAALVLAGCVAYGMLSYATIRPGDRCLVVGASGGIGSVLVPMLIAKGAHVTAVASTRNLIAVKANGANDVIDYTKGPFSDTILSKERERFDFVFDSVGGIDIEQQAQKVLFSPAGKFLTVSGPVKYIGETKLSWAEVIAMLWHVLHRSVVSRFVGPKYQFSEKYPCDTIDEMLDFVVKHNIRMVVDREIPFEFGQVKEALLHLATHKATGRIVLDMQSRQESSAVPPGF